MRLRGYPPPPGILSADKTYPVITLCNKEISYGLRNVREVNIHRVIITLAIAEIDKADGRAECLHLCQYRAGTVSDQQYAVRAGDRLRQIVFISVRQLNTQPFAL